MHSMTLHMRDGDVIFHCTSCARDFYVDSSKPFVPQLRALSYEHHCAGMELAGESATRRPSAMPE